MAARLAVRRGDASDASAAVLQQQLAAGPGTLDWTRLEAGGDGEATLAAAHRALVH
jgi:hypothetical protein